MVLKANPRIPNFAERFKKSRQRSSNLVRWLKYKETFLALKVQKSKLETKRILNLQNKMRLLSIYYEISCTFEGINLNVKGHNVVINIKERRKWNGIGECKTRLN